jgi:hypothetical protein
MLSRQPRPWTWASPTTRRHGTPRKSSSGRDGKAGAAAGKKNRIDSDATPLVEPPRTTTRACKSEAPFLLPPCVRLLASRPPPLIRRLPLPARVFPHTLFFSAKCQQRWEASFHMGVGSATTRGGGVFYMPLCILGGGESMQVFSTNNPRVHRGEAQKDKSFWTSSCTHALRAFYNHHHRANDDASY